jgi:hypothetical protein
MNLHLAHPKERFSEPSFMVSDRMSAIRAEHREQRGCSIGARVVASGSLNEDTALTLLKGESNASSQSPIDATDGTAIAKLYQWHRRIVGLFADIAVAFLARWSGSVGPAIASPHPRGSQPP